jgi:hypothetical protein
MKLFSVIEHLRRSAFILVVLVSSSLGLYAQVSVNTDGAPADSSAMLDIKSGNKGLLIPRLTQSERDLISHPATGLMIYQTNGTPGFYYYNGSSWIAVSTGAHYPGELYGGGVVCWVDQTGQHGLIVSMADLSTSYVWSNVSSGYIGATAQSDWDGPGNSNAIVAQAGHTRSAAKLCLDYVNAEYGTGIFSDWYLPSRGEMNLLWNNIFSVQKALDSDNNSATTLIGKVTYWTSSENSGLYGWDYQFYLGTIGFIEKSTNYAVRAFRKF